MVPSGSMYLALENCEAPGAERYEQRVPRSGVFCFFPQNHPYFSVKDSAKAKRKHIAASGIRWCCAPIYGQPHGVADVASILPSRNCQQGGDAHPFIVEAEVQLKLLKLYPEIRTGERNTSVPHRAGSQTRFNTGTTKTLAPLFVVIK